MLSDGPNNRVLIWNSVPTTSGQPSDLVLGQSDFSANASGNGAGGMWGPNGVWTDGTKLVVVDSFNNRVLIWSAFPTSTGAAADVVRGSATFGETPSTSPPTASSFFAPEGVTVANGRLYVADQGNNRVLVWKSIPSTNNVSADLVLDQTGFDTAYNNGGAPYPQVNAVGIVSPSITVDECGSMYVCDSGNGCVLVYTRVPTANALAADAVLGKPTLTSQSSATATASAQWLDTCGGLWSAGNILFVTDPTDGRARR